MEAVKTGLEREHGRFEERVGDVSKSREISRSKRIGALFLASRAIAAVPGITDQKLRPSEVKCVGVVGGGLMGMYCNRVSFERH